MRELRGGCNYTGREVWVIYWGEEQWEGVKGEEGLGADKGRR